ncbi:excalibur calcium-binding protein [Streptomyces sp. AD55]|uniref:excalibur calcium-binding protein n=1 Tax=Streptomyces sp. AD55 TaxID=3242895 RepID=UPI003529B312
MRRRTGAAGTAALIAALALPSAPARADGAECRDAEGTARCAAVDAAPPSISATSRPLPAASAPPAAVPAPDASGPVAPTRGVRGGVGGAAKSGPSDRDVGIGLTFVLGSALAAGYVIRWRRRR